MNKNLYGSSESGVSPSLILPVYEVFYTNGFISINESNIKVKFINICKDLTKLLKFKKPLTWGLTKILKKAQVQLSVRICKIWGDFNFILKDIFAM